MIDDLDKMLFQLYKDRRKFLIQELNSIMGDSNKDFRKIQAHIILEKLQKDGYVESDSGRLAHQAVMHYHISVDGVLFFERSLLRNRPYKSEIITKRIKSIWAVTKIVMAAISTLAIVWISWLTYEAQREANMLEKNKKNEPLPIINVIIDTVKKK